MFHRVIFILLIVSSLFLNLIAAQLVFSRTYNKTSHAGVLKMLRVNITWQNHKEREIKPKHNIKFSIMLKLKCSFKRLRQLGLQIWCLTKVRTRPAGGVDINAKFAINLHYSYKKNLAIKSLCVFYKPICSSWKLARPWWFWKFLDRSH